MAAFNVSLKSHLFRLRFMIAAGGPSAEEDMVNCGLHMVEGSGLSGGLPSRPFLGGHLGPCSGKVGETAL